MKTVIFGNGLLGSEIKRQTGWDCINRSEHGIDITLISTYIKYLSRYDQVVNCIGYTNTWDDKKEPSWSVNYVGVIDLVDICNRYNKKLIHISTDYIYANSKPNASESDVPVHFDNWYTYSKLLADGYVQAKCTDYLLIRTSFKPKPFPWDEAWDNLIGNFDYIDVVASQIIKLIDIRAIGLFNIGTEFKSMHELALETKPHCNINHRKSSPYNISMNLNKFKDILKIKI